MKLFYLQNSRIKGISVYNVQDTSLHKFLCFKFKKQIMLSKINIKSVK
jgi:hypothetical protein